MPSLTLLKSASTSSVSAAGTPVTYTFEVRNTGNVPLSSVTVAETAFSGTGPVPVITCPAGAALLAPGASVTCTAAPYVVTQADVDAGSITNTALATGTPPSGAPVTDTDSEIVTATSSPAITLVKTASPSTVSAAGAPVTYSFVVRNTGNVTLSPVTVAETAFSGTGTAPVISCPAGAASLAPGASVTCTAPYTVTQADINAGVVTNTALATGTPPVGAPVTATDSATLTASTAPGFTVAKSASATVADLGGTITYTVQVANTGNQDYTAGNPARFTDNLAGVLDDAAYNGDASGTATVTGTTLSWSGPLAVGATVTITYSVTVPSSITGNGVLSNVVTPVGTGGVCASAASCTTSTPIRAYTVVKTSSDAVVNPGGTVEYTVSVTNIGQSPYTAGSLARFTDDLSAVLDDAVYNNDASPGASVDGTTLTWAGELAVGATVDVTYSVTVNDADALNDGVLDNAVVPTGPGGQCVDPDDCVTTTDVQAFTVVKTSSASVANPGDIVTYSVTVTNVGSVAYAAGNLASFTDSLADVLDDATYNNDASNGATVSAGVLSWSGALAVDASVTITYSVTVNAPATGDRVMNNVVIPGVTGVCVDLDDCETATPVRSFAVLKTADVSTVIPGDTVTYTVQVTNTGAAPYTAGSLATFTDDLSDVLDDAGFNNDVAVVGGGSAAFDALSEALTWSGELALGATVTVTYSVTVSDPITGNEVLENVVITPPSANCPPGSTDSACITISNSGSYTLQKSASASSVLPGGTVTYTVLVTNTGSVDYVGANLASFTDNLSSVLDDAEYNDDASNGASITGSTLSWQGELLVGETAMITYSVTVNDPPTGNFDLGNVVVPTTPGGSCDDPADCVTSTPVQAFTVAKTSSEAVANPGDSVQYTVSVTNIGQVAYTDTNRASFTDDLSAVLDDAVYNGDASAGASVVDTTLIWSGELAVGATVDVTYSVTVNAAADLTDRVLDNVVVPAGPGGLCLDPDDCVTSTPVQAFTVVKTSSESVVNPGDTVTYTVTVTNAGSAAYTAPDLASFTDDLSAVLDDATYNGDASQGATVAGTTLTWAGPLAVGASVEVTYSVTVRAAADLADGVLDNAVVPTGPGGECVDTDDCVTSTDVQAFTVAKTSSNSVANPGDTVEYTVTVVNTGAVAYTVGNLASFDDDLSAVLDDAIYNNDASSGATVSGTTLTWEGPLAVGASVDVTYSVTVRDAADLNDGVLTNVVIPTGPGGECVDVDSCTTTTNSQQFTVVKTSSESVVNPGDVVQYVVTVTNTGNESYTAPNLASFTDDLSAVLDDATYNGDASPGATVAGTTLTWAGPLAVGASVEVTYSVTVRAAADLTDGVLDNVVVPTGPGGLCVDSDDCVTSTDVQAFTVAKTSASGAVVNSGDVVEYTVTVTNTGNAPYTAGDRASFTDDLSAVLDDAVYNGDASSGAIVIATTLSWSGELAVGASVDVTYSVTVNAAADLTDGVLDNVVVPTAPGGECASADDCVTSTGVQAFTVAKTSPETVVNPGETVSYTVTVTNTGVVGYTAGDLASFTDDLSAVLDDATYNGDASAGATVVGNTLRWEGPLAVGETLTVTYSVTVNAAADLNDGVLVNAVVPDAPGGDCATPEDCVTTTDVQAFTVAKTASTEVVTAGGTVEYAVTVVNTGNVAYTADDRASFTDDLSAVLDDAVYNDDASSGATVVGTTLSWSGELAVGATVVVTYSVTVNAAAALGSAVLDNVVAPAATGGECETTDDCATSTPVQAFTVAKATSASVVGPTDTLTYTIEVVNTGSVDFTDLNPAVFTDDLSEVLDDAVYNDDASLGGAYVEPVIAWAVSVGTGESITVTYSVTVSAAGSGDGRLVNAVVPDDEVGGGCAADDACATDTPVRFFTAVKSVDAAVIGLGQVLRYEIVLTNPSEADYTAESPASFVDDLSEVLDDGVFGNDATNGAVYSAPELTWSGPLAVGESVTISYTVRLHDRITGDAELVNTVFTPADGTCPVPEGVQLNRGAFASGMFSGAGMPSASALEMPEGCVAISITRSPLASTGASELLLPLVAAGLLAFLVGFGLMVSRRRSSTGVPGESETP